MDIEWKESEMIGRRLDLDLMLGEDVVGFFRNYKPGHLMWISKTNKWREENMSHLTLEEAKSVVEAMIQLEG